MLTSVLRDSLGGNCMTTMIATMAVERRNLEVSMVTMRTCSDKSLRFPQKTILYCSFRTLLLSVGFVEKLSLPLLSLCMHSFEEMYSITWLLNYGVIRGIHFSPSYWQIRSLTDFSNYFPQESISTCRFAQRVAVIKNEAILNEELDPALVRQSDARVASPGPRNSDAELHNHTTDPWLNVPFYFGQTLP